MSAEDVQVVRRMFERFEAGDADGSLACFAPDVEVDASRRIDGGVAHGHEGLQRIIREWVGTWEDYRHETVEVHDCGDKVMGVAKQFGRGKGSGVEIEHEYAYIFELRDGKITRYTIYLDRDEASRDAGLDA
jgi:ketosteroid isomerase-like protein